MAVAQGGPRRTSVATLAVRFYPAAPAVLAVAAAGAAPLLALALWVGRREDLLTGLGALAASLLTWGWLCAKLWRHRRDDGGGRPRAPALPLAAATAVTLCRGWLVSAVAAFILSPTRSLAGAWLVALAYTAAALLDGVDGRLARARGQTTRVGAALDVATDAVGLLVAPLVAVRAGQLPPWYLLLAFAYPVFQLALRTRERLGLPVHRERLRPDPRARFFAGVQMGVVATALYPVLPHWLLWTGATLLMLPTLALFLGEWRQATGR